MDAENEVLGKAVAERNAWRSCALELGQALRRCGEDSKDFYAGRVPDRMWVEDNIASSETALSALNELRKKEETP